MACKKLLLLAHPLFHLDPCWQNLLEGLCFFVLEILVEGRGGKGEFRRGYRMRLWVCGSNSPGKRRRSEGVLSIRVVVVEGDWVLDCFLMVFWGILLQLTFGFAVSLLGWTRFPFLAASTPNPSDRLENLLGSPLRRAASTESRIGRHPKNRSPPCFPRYLLTTSLYLSLGHPALLLLHKFSTKDPGWVVTERFLFARLFLVLISISVSPLAIAVHQLKLLFLMYDSCIPLVLRQRPFS